MNTIKAITLTQPWATLLAIGGKHFETRSWKTDYRGPLVIHAAKTMPRYAKDFIAYSRTCHEWLVNNDIRIGPLARPESWIPMGQVVARTFLVACVQVNEYTKTHGAWIDPVRGPSYHIVLPPNPPELEFGDYSDGRWVWVLDETQALPEPIPAKGAQGLWNWTPPDELTWLFDTQSKGASS